MEKQIIQENLFQWLLIKKNCKAKYIGDLTGFHNVASSISDYFGLENIFPGNSFLNDI